MVRVEEKGDRGRVPPAPAGAIVLAVLLAGLWWWAAEAEVAPSYLLPSPGAVAAVFANEWRVLFTQALVTLVEWAIGLGLAVTSSFAICAACYASGTVRAVVRPLLVASQAVPYLTFAPLLLLWLGLGMTPKVVLVVLTCLFPITLVWLDSLLRARDEFEPVCALVKMSPTRTFFSVSLPGSLPGFFSGLKVSVSYAVVSAVLAELIGSEAGLGVYITRAQSAYRLDRVVAAVLLVVTASLLSTALVDAIRKRVVFWPSRP